MTDAHIRLQQARKKAGFETASDAARAFGWNENTYRSHENSERGLKMSVASRYASALRVSLGWLMTGEGLDTEQKISRIMGYIGSGGNIVPNYFDHRDKLLTLPIVVTPSAKCLVFMSDAYYPRYQTGDLVFCDECINGEKAKWSKDKDYLPLEGLLILEELKTRFGWLHHSDEPRLEVVGSVPIRGFAMRAFLPVQAVVRLGTYNATPVHWEPER